MSNGQYAPNVKSPTMRNTISENESSEDGVFAPNVCLINGCDITGYICNKALRTLDLNARRCKQVGQADDSTMDDVLARIGPMFGI